MPLAAREAAAAWDRAIRNTYSTGGAVWAHPHVTYTTTSSTMTNAVWNVNTTTATNSTTTWLLNYNLPEQAYEYRQRELEARLWQGHDIMEWQGTVDEGDPMRQPDPELAAAHRARIRERNQEREQRMVAQDETRVRAERRAAASLRVFLGDARHDYWVKNRVLVVRGSDGGIFVLRPGTITNITQIGEDRITTRRLCVHPELAVRDDAGRYLGELPIDDVIIGQVLALTSHERDFLRLANVTRVTRSDVQGIGQQEWQEWLRIEQREDNPDTINGGGRQVVVHLNDERTPRHDDELTLGRALRHRDELRELRDTALAG